MRTVRAFLAFFAVLAVAGCAVSSHPTTSEGQKLPSAAVAALDRAIAAEKDQAVMPELLFKRGHAELEEAERFLQEHPSFLEQKQGYSIYGAYFMAAIDDFLTIVNRYPQSTEAPEAMYHLGVIHDYPNLASFDLALDWYRKTAERYPGTESARKALAGIKLIEKLKEMHRQGPHGSGSHQSRNDLFSIFRGF